MQEAIKESEDYENKEYILRLTFDLKGLILQCSRKHTHRCLFDKIPLPRKKMNLSGNSSLQMEYGSNVSDSIPGVWHGEF